MNLNANRPRYVAKNINILTIDTPVMNKGTRYDAENVPTIKMHKWIRPKFVPVKM